MCILITGAGGNIGKGVVPRLKAAGHDLVLSDLNKLPDAEPFVGLPFVQCDVQAGFGLERAVQDCDLILHTPAWHGVHSRAKTEADFWRLNVDGTFWMFQAAQGMAQTKHLHDLPGEHPITHVLAPFNAFNRSAAALFVTVRARGLHTVAMSPFVRGWKLDEIGEDSTRVADILLRWVAMQPQVDSIDVAVRKREWVAANLLSLSRGPLSSSEQAQVDTWLKGKPA